MAQTICESKAMVIYFLTSQLKVMLIKLVYVIYTIYYSEHILSLNGI